MQVAEHRKNAEVLDLPPVKKDDEIDMRLREIMIKTKVPIKFIRIGEGLYIFGSKRVHVKIQNSKLVIRIGGGYMYVEEFIKLYAQQELAKLKNSKEESMLKNVETHEYDLDGPKSFLHPDESLNASHFRDLEYLKGNEIKLLPNLVSNFDHHEAKKIANERSKTPDRYREVNESSFIIPFTDQASNVSIDNVFYEITPKIELNGSSSKKKPQNSQRTKTPDPKSHAQYESELTLKGTDFDLTKRTPRKSGEIQSAREGLSSKLFPRK